MAIFYGNIHDLKSAYAILGCTSDCDANRLVQQGHDPYWLACFFATIDDTKSADTCLRLLWSRMITHEQKEQFFRYIVEGGNNVWVNVRKARWIQKAYNEFNTSKYHSADL